MFITELDYKGVSDQNALDIYSQSDEQTRIRAERVAMEEIASYIRSRYDTDKAFATTEDDRNPMLVQITVNISLYYLVQWLPQYMSFDSRKQLYDDAIAWLVRVQSGKASPNLPTYTSEDGTDDGSSSPIRFGSMPKSSYDY